MQLAMCGWEINRGFISDVVQMNGKHVSLLIQAIQHLVTETGRPVLLKGNLFVWAQEQKNNAWNYHMLFSQFVDIFLFLILPFRKDLSGYREVMIKVIEAHTFFRAIL